MRETLSAAGWLWALGSGLWALARKCAELTCATTRKAVRMFLVSFLAGSPGPRAQRPARSIAECRPEERDLFGAVSHDVHALLVVELQAPESFHALHVELEVHLVTDEARHHHGHSQHVDHVRMTGLTVDVLVLPDCFGEVLRESPVVDDRFTDVRMPIAHDLPERRRVLEQGSVPVRAREDIDLADVVEKAGQHGFIRIDATRARGNRVRERRD